jgi:hypothetical protein
LKGFLAYQFSKYLHPKAQSSVFRVKKVLDKVVRLIEHPTSRTPLMEETKLQTGEIDKYEPLERYT